MRLLLPTNNYRATAVEQEACTEYFLSALISRGWRRGGGGCHGQSDISYIFTSCVIRAHLSPPYNKREVRRKGPTLLLYMYTEKRVALAKDVGTDLARLAVISSACSTVAVGFAECLVLGPFDTGECIGGRFHFLQYFNISTSTFRSRSALTQLPPRRGLLGLRTYIMVVDTHVYFHTNLSL